jgi:hypothetical protein
MVCGGMEVPGTFLMRSEDGPNNLSSRIVLQASTSGRSKADFCRVRPLYFKLTGEVVELDG